MTRRLTLILATAAVLSADAFVTSPSAGRAAVAATTSLEARADCLGEDTSTMMGHVGKAIATAALAMAVFDPSPAFADGQTEKFKLPPIDKNDKMRCTFNDSKMGQANAQRDKVSLFSSKTRLTRHEQAESKSWLHPIHSLLSTDSIPMSISSHSNAFHFPNS
jgi:hypothetical protein